MENNEKAACELLTTCIFFKDEMANMPLASDLMKDTYCRGNNSLCARYMVFKALGREKVPRDLFPDERKKAKEIIEKGKSSS